MSLADSLRREYTFLTSVGRTFYRMRHVKPEARYTINDIVEDLARRSPDATAILCENQLVTYEELVQGANRYSRWAMRQGVRRGDAVGLFMENRPEYLMAWLGIVKLGGVVAL